ncbi:hypothetical protein I4U23_022227 [Adineta vaga]|nr:hypothetical protein I4U23_022227 [Adineta vaga]
MIITIVLTFLLLQCLLDRTIIPLEDYSNITYQIMNSMFENIRHIQRPMTNHDLIENLSILFIIIQSLNDIEQIVYTILRFCLPSKSHPTLSSVSTADEYSLVGVQLPMMNEKEFCISMITSACNLDWPKDRLIIQVLDDSTDEKVMIMIDQCVQIWLDRGYRISVVRRENRHGFKAGNLKNGLEKLHQCEFIALFDVDFLPKKNFLKKTIPILLKDPKSAYVQARWTFLNGKESLLTQMQEIVLNHHHICEQEVKYRMSSFFQFNGSACVWRTKSIYQCGGWHTDTLVEDLDISVRAYINGWHSSYIIDVECLNELPPTFEAYLSQQYRWFSGPAQVFRKLFQTVSGFLNLNSAKKWIVTPKFGTQTRLNIEEIQVDAYHNDNTNVQCCNDLGKTQSEGARKGVLRVILLVVCWTTTKFTQIPLLLEEGLIGFKTDTLVAFKAAETEIGPVVIRPLELFNTTAHGIPHTARSKNIPNRIFWTVSTVVFTGILLYFIIQSVKSYFSYPSQTLVDPDEEWPQFSPATISQLYQFIELDPVS